MPQASIQDLHSAVLQALQQDTGEARVVVFGCNHSIDVTKLRRPGVTGINLECLGLLPASFIDFTLREGADGVFLTGCRMGDCYHRLGNQLMQERLDGERKPKLSRSVARERVEFFMAAEGDRGKLLQELELFYHSLPSLDAVADGRQRSKRSTTI